MVQGAAKRLVHYTFTSGARILLEQTVLEADSGVLLPFHPSPHLSGHHSHKRKWERFMVLWGTPLQNQWHLVSLPYWEQIIS